MTSDETKKHHREQHRLSAIPGLSPEAVAALKTRWLETAEQVLAASATQAGREGLKSLLKTDEAGLQVFLDRLAEAVGPEEARRLRTPKPGGKLGALRREEDK
ncbi:MAG TPA: hypothetical protein VM223_20390 [Planctomycetota bacterium]|nr:hypothetical protein [Planctomycetota bacterium]